MTLRLTDPLFTEVAAYYDLNPDWLRAIATIESGLDPNVRPRWEPHLQEHSYGIGQFLPSTALWIVHTPSVFLLPTDIRDELLGCAGRSKEAGERVVNQCLMQPDVGLYLMGAYLRYQLDRYDGDITRAVAAYNAGSARLKGNVFVNQWHVDKFHRTLDDIRAV